MTAVFAIAAAVAAIWSVHKRQAAVDSALTNSFALEFQDLLNSRSAFPEFAGGYRIGAVKGPTRSLVFYFSRIVKIPAALCGVATLLSLSLGGAPAFSQVANPCVEAASLWLPSDTTREKVVTKWQKAISFAIISHENESALVKSIEAELRFISQQTGLKLDEEDRSSNALPDLLVVVDPNVVENASLLRELALKFFQSKFSVGGRFQIDADRWNASLRSILPKCAGIDVELNHEKSLSFVYVQENEAPACVGIALSQAFGVIGARSYYAANGEKISEAIVGEALRGLYSQKIRAGMSRAEASEQLNEACKK